MIRRVFAALLLSSAGVAHAADKPVYAPAPDWVKPAPPIDVAKVNDASPIPLLVDAQVRLQDGQVWTYGDTATRVASADLLNSLGTITLPWQPSEGDLIIHKVEIIRGNQHIDLIAAGAKFTVLRREEQLEQYSLTGLLSATMQVQDLRVGDILHMSFSMTQRDPTLKDNMDTVLPLVADPLRVGFARVRLIWPEKSNVRWKAYAASATPTIVTADGYKDVTFTLPLAKQPDIAPDSPVRFQHPPLVEATNFADWQSVSKVMAPLYRTDGLITPGSPLDTEVKRIATAESDPLKRTELALELVQSKVRYMFVGLGTGGYTPQPPAETWTERYGDCKAKTLLLLAVLHALGIEAEPAATSSTFHDFSQDRLPGAGAFDHIFVHATVGGQSLWLDGTGLGARLADIHDVPPFVYVLPIRANGADLFKLPDQANARPDADVSLVLDQRAGIPLPTVYHIALKTKGPTATMMATAYGQAGKDQKEDLVRSVIGNFVPNGVIDADSLSYDDVSGVTTITASGLVSSMWQTDGENRRRRLQVDRVVSAIDFSPDRSRTIWQSIPAATDQTNMVYHTQVLLPDGGTGYTIEGATTLPPVLATTHLTRSFSQKGAIVTIDDTASSGGGEVAPTDIATAKSAVAQAKQRLLTVVAPDKVPGRWQIALQPDHDRLFKPLIDSYGQAISAHPDEAYPYQDRAAFLIGIYDRKGALADLDKVIAIAPDAPAYLRRANLYRALGDKAKEEADIASAAKLDPDSPAVIGAQAHILIDHHDFAGALALIEPKLAAGGKDKVNYISAKAEIQRRSGDTKAALATLDAALADDPNNPALLNNRCWLKGTMQIELDTALKDCTKAIEFGDAPSGSLDSRAMVLYRLGHADDAMADLNAALQANIDNAGSLFMRAVLRKAAGDAKNAAVDIAGARLIYPEIDKDYADYGIHY
jgi:tetratricopeptide (TPR) repeat protein